jgi:hypothetical protein
MPFNMPMMLLCGSVSALWALVREIPAPALAPSYTQPIPTHRLAAATT